MADVFKDRPRRPPRQRAAPESPVEFSGDLEEYVEQRVRDITKDVRWIVAHHYGGPGQLDLLTGGGK